MPDDITAAIDSVARQLVWQLVEDHAGEAWESFPEVDQDDWLRIVKRAKALAEAPLPEVGEYRDAYVLLGMRAQQSAHELG